MSEEEKEDGDASEDDVEESGFWIESRLVFHDVHSLVEHCIAEKISILNISNF